jgi:hypothetical protein
MGCAAPVPIQTNLGAFTIQGIYEPTLSGVGYVDLGQFTAVATAPPVVAFSAFTAKAEISATPPTSFQIYGSFTPGASSNGINPLSEPVALQIGTFSVTIPPGSFVKTDTGRYVYEGTFGGQALRVGITPVTATTYNFKAVGWGTNLSGTTNPVTVGLTIGDDTGTAAVTAQFQSGGDR